MQPDTEARNAASSQEFMTPSDRDEDESPIAALERIAIEDQWEHGYDRGTRGFAG